MAVRGSRGARWNVAILAGTLLGAGMLGCGGGGEGAPPDGPATAEVDTFGPPPMSIELAPDDEFNPSTRTAEREELPQPEPVVGGPERGTPEWYLQEIQVLRASSLPDPGAPKNPKKPEDGAYTAEDVEAALEKRNNEIVDLAMQVIVRTHEDPNRQDLFEEGVRRMVEARLQLALTGDEQYGRDLYADAGSFHRRDPKSRASAIAAHALLRYAQTNAFRYGGDDKEWLQEYARQARSFATNFPGDERLCTASLAGAARSCELNGLREEAASCHAMLVDKFPRSEHAKMSAGVLRRFELVGQPLVLAGPTLDGGFTSVKDHEGRVVLVVFWNSAAKPFRDQVAAVSELSKKYQRYGLNVLGVCLDEDERAAKSFLAERDLAWPQLFHSEVSQRGWEHPAAIHYGVRDVPTYFLVDHRGIVRLVASDTENFEPAIRQLLTRLRAELNAGTE